ncbi:MAG: hypothetical protein Q9221_008424 [Calogaya cf. arnoldii]
MHAHSSLFGFVCIQLLGLTIAMPKPPVLDAHNNADPFNWLDMSDGINCRSSFIKYVDEFIQGRCTLTKQAKFTASATFTVGGDIGIGIGEILTAGISDSKSQSERAEYSYTAGAEKDCPEGSWYCGLVFNYEVQHIVGKKFSNMANKRKEGPHGIMV